VAGTSHVDNARHVAREGARGYGAPFDRCGVVIRGREKEKKKDWMDAS